MIRALPQTSRHQPERQQSLTLRMVVREQLDPCWVLDQLIDDLLARAETPEEEDRVEDLGTRIVLEIAARKAAKRGLGPLAVRDASLAEQPDDAALDHAQLVAMDPHAPVSALHTLHDCAIRVVRRAQELALAARAAIGQRERAPRVGA